MAESGLPALLLQCLYLFFVFPLEKDEIFENDVQVQRMFVQVSKKRGWTPLGQDHALLLRDALIFLGPNAEAPLFSRAQLTPLSPCSTNAGNPVHLESRFSPSLSISLYLCINIPLVLS